MRTRQPLSIELGPGMLDEFFDGIQRPLRIFAEGDDKDKIFLPKFNREEIGAIDPKKLWNFKPSNDIQIGSILTGGDIVGTCYENELFPAHKIMVPPRTRGKVVSIVEEGNYSVKDALVELEYEGKIAKVFLSHFWPIHQPRPCLEHLASTIKIFISQKN